MANGKGTKKAGQLTAKQELFVQEYLKDSNAMQAAIRAGYAESTAKAKSSAWVGKSRNDCPVKYQHIWDAVQQAKQERIERVKVDADYVLTKLVTWLETSVKQAFDENGMLKNIHDIPDEVLDMIADMAGLEEFNGFGDDREVIGLVRKLKLTSKLDILKQIGQHVQVNAFKEQVDVTGSLNVADQLMKANNRTRKTLIASAGEEKDG